MITNLFSIFDPSARLGGSSNWISIGLVLVILPIAKWQIVSRRVVVTYYIFGVLCTEIKALLISSAKHTLIIFVTLFTLIISINILGLIPYVFTPTRHLTITLRLALPLWLGYFTYGWVNSTKWILAHLVPQGTPSLLLPFIVLIERISSIIRPLTLSVRLAANIIAGHLLLTLIRNAIRVFRPVAAVSIVVVQISLVILEVAVAAIQSYVFTILRVLYAREI